MGDEAINKFHPRVEREVHRHSRAADKMSNQPTGGGTRL